MGCKRSRSRGAAPGTLTVIVWANGSGKLTLLRIAAGSVSPSWVFSHKSQRTLPTSRKRQPARLKFSAAEYSAKMGYIKGLATLGGSPEGC